MVRDRAVVVVRKGARTIGIQAEELPTWCWYVGCLGQMKWVISSKDIPARLPSDPVWYPTGTDPAVLDPVEILLLQGQWDSLDHRILNNGHTRLILRCVESRARGSKGAKRVKPNTNASGVHITNNLPVNWEAGTFQLAHKFLGGATNGRFQVEWARPNSVPTPVFISPPGLQIKLGNVLSPFDQFAFEAQEPDEGDINTSKGLLNWKRKTDQVVVPHLYKKDVWVRRWLSQKELGVSLDFPGTRMSRLEEHQLKLLTNSEIPGKVFTACLWFLSDQSGSKREKRKGQDINNLTAAPVKMRRIQEEYGLVYEGVDLEPIEQETKEGGYQLDKDESEDEVTDKATKADDAAVPEHLWNDRIAEQLMLTWKRESRKEIGSYKQKRNRGKRTPPPLTFKRAPDKLRFKWALRRIRRFALNYWKKKVKRDFERWFSLIEEGVKNKEEILIDGQAACKRAAQASWWNWDKGSSIFFWRWPPDYQEAARIGLAPMFNSDAPTNCDRQPPYEDPDTKRKVKEKLQGVIDKGYIEMIDIELVEAMMFMFHVPKGETDIRMVYDGTKSGLNDALYSPWFSLPTIDTMIRWVMAGSWLADNDYGEQFLNFPLHPDLRKYCGVDLSQLFDERNSKKQATPTVGAWMRNAMGLKSSPYNSVQGSLRAKRLVLGHPKDPNNPFGWNEVTTNLPGSKNYDPTRPWILKTRKDGLHASDICQYVDDVRIIAATEELAWRCSSRMAKGLSWLGLQDAARKRRSPSKEPGAWAGATVSSNNGTVTKGVTQERWNKVKTRVRWIAKQLGLTDKFSPELYGELDERMESDGIAPEGHVHFKTTESCVGFLVYVAMTYPSMVPYLKGIYLTLNSWRPGRNTEGWSIKKKLREARKSATSNRENPPTWVRSVERLKTDLLALMELTAHDSPPRVPARATNKEACYIVGDASGSGFGSSAYRATAGKDSTEEDVIAEYGTWTEPVTRNLSSNFRETANLVNKLRTSLQTGEIERGSEVFVFTDNSCAERTMYRGSSKSKLLHNMVLDLRKMAMVGDIIVHFVWISGERMIHQGTDGLSRGDFSSGIMAGEEFLKFLPIHESATERQADNGLEARILGWCPNTPGRTWKLAKTSDWFHEVFQDPKGAWIWCPPPCIAKVAVEQLCEVKHVFPQSQHLFVCPTLMTGIWRKQLSKLADAGVTVKAGNQIWPKEMFEPLTIALIAPLLSTSPWKQGRTTRVENWEDYMQALPTNSTQAFRTGMRKFWLQNKRR